MTAVEQRNLKQSQQLANKITCHMQRDIQPYGLFI